MKPPINSLTGLRFIAAFLIILHHFGNPPGPQPVHNVISHGFVAVSLFFILSGFILTYNYADNVGGLKTGKWNFWVARFARIYPNAIKLSISDKLFEVAGRHRWRVFWGIGGPHGPSPVSQPGCQ
ncbi:acyltransferase family protein, partial [Polaromonas sp.]|uniref:acyltransferase family protein n=1 Tax=Polaromonas sp. TaxID=1869339 RepID=UPI003BB4C6E9